MGSLPFDDPGKSLGQIIVIGDLDVVQEEQVTVFVFPHPFIEVVPVPVILCRRVVYILIFCQIQNLLVSSLEVCNDIRFRLCSQLEGFPVVDGLTEKFPHFSSPGKICLILDAGQKVSQDMRQAFLMTAPIVIEGAVMAVDKGVEEVLDRCPLDPFVSFVLSGLDEDISIFIPAQMDMNVITVYLCGGKVCMERIRLDEPVKQFIPFSP